GALNVIGEPDHPALRKATETVYAAARRAGIPTHVPAIGLTGWSKEDIRASGLKVVSSADDARAMLQGMQADLAALGEIGPGQGGNGQGGAAAGDGVRGEANAARP